MKAELTDLEKAVMINIAESEYIDVASLDELVDYPTWSFVATNETKILAGALGSLVKKGLVICSKDNGSDNGKDKETCWLTANGVEQLKRFYCYR
jgi:hypothetical protein